MNGFRILIMIMENGDSLWTVGRMFKRPFQRLRDLEIGDGRGFLGSFSSIVFVGQFLR